MRAMILVTSCLCLIASLPSGATRDRWRTLRTSGVTVRYPATWHATTRPLTLVTAPSQLLAIASFPFPTQPRPNGCAPQGTLDAMPPDSALIIVLDYGTNLDNSRFPPRPAQFTLGSARHYECLGARPTHRILFKQANRYFQLMVALGNRAEPHTRATVHSILNNINAK